MRHQNKNVFDILKDMFHIRFYKNGTIKPSHRNVCEMFLLPLKQQENSRSKLITQSKTINLIRTKYYAYSDVIGTYLCRTRILSAAYLDSPNIKEAKLCSYHETFIKRHTISSPNEISNEIISNLFSNLHILEKIWINQLLISQR